MADPVVNPISKLSLELDAIVATPEQKVAIESKTDQLWRDSWNYHCTHMQKHLDAIAIANPNDKEVQARVALLSSILVSMRENGMPEIAAIVEVAVG